MQTFYHISRRYGGDYPRKRQQFQVDDYFALTISCAARRASAREVVRREGIVSKITHHCAGDFQYQSIRPSMRRMQR